VADLTSSDRSSNGATERQRNNIAPALSRVRDERLVAADSEQTAADSDQTIADSDQTSADSDQTSADSDQGSSDRDQAASDRDQAASDRDLEAGSDPDVHDDTREVREQTTRERDHTAQARLDAGELRDASARARDLAARARDQAAEARMLAMAQSDAAYEQDEQGDERRGTDAVIRAAGARKRAARRRAQAAEFRELAALDRTAAAEDRDQAAQERLRALVDREALAHQVAIAETDPLTGARTRAAGLTDLDHEIDRCRRTTGRLVVTYLDVVGLKALNDTKGHSAGDALIRRITELIKQHLRPYDLMIRVGGDEFLVVTSNLALPEARKRFSAIAAAIADGPSSGGISTGFAELRPDESAAELIARADSDLLDNRRANQDSRPAVAQDAAR